VSAHKELVAHEAGHIAAGMLEGLRPHHVSAPPLPSPEYAAAHPHEQAGVATFYRGDQRTLGVATLAGMLADHSPIPDWPLDNPRTPDERDLAEVFAETDELVYGEAVADARRLMSSKTFTRLHGIVSELLSHPPHELGEQQLVDLHKLMGEVQRSMFPVQIKCLDASGGKRLDERLELGIKAGISDAINDAFDRVDALSRQPRPTPITTFDC
jgi:hypothetical protein